MDFSKITEITIDGRKVTKLSIDGSLIWTAPVARNLTVLKFGAMQSLNISHVARAADEDFVTIDTGD